MSKREKPQPSQLAVAADALDTQLRRFEDLAEQLRRLPLDSEKNLERASKLLQEVAALDERLSAHVSDLVVAVTAARERQAVQANTVQARAHELEARVEVFKTLLTRYAALGQGAVDLNAEVQQFASRRSSASSSEDKAHLALDLEALLGRMGQLAEQAQGLVLEAHQCEFTDVARQADSLRQQLQSARNKLGLLHKDLPTA